MEPEPVLPLGSVAGGLTRTAIISRFASKGLPADAESVVAGRGDHALNPGMHPTGELIPAAVLVPLVDRPDGMTVLFTRRTAHLANHAGQVSFPGGHIEEADGTPLEAALRETEEEVGLARDRIETIGRLDTYVTRTGFHVVPVVGLVTPPFDVKPDPHEVDEVFEVPLSFLLNPANHQRHSVVYEGEPRYFHAMPYGDYYIWGATAGMLINLYEVLSGPENS
ncbi:MAG: CoA pyrophosphatase [Rhodospirillales bacterium]|nr:CoA pyrophosphatase [Rhodospirillales bacterium]MCW8863205.1 CoA pyrophosphatase [Rhodospirillales bacterium]MCW8952997.1 CoA pyrophosphatase [Rhodospirillales bacterium]MCW8969848.1 CoA pyrophosphatase [Rhodospirillales bacterium]MCW9002071.1 CoA pyrophosphatase [Rhodospirillales bacterium]